MLQNHSAYGKGKLCTCEMECNPVHRPYAKGHYESNDAVFDFHKIRYVCKIGDFRASREISGWSVE